MKWDRLTAGISAAAMLLSMVSVFPAQAADPCVIDTGKEYQTIRGFGGMNLPEWQGSDLSDAQRKTAFGNGDGELGLTILRVFVNPDSSQWNKCVPTAKYAQSQGATVFATPWEPPSNLAESGGSNGKLHLPKQNYGAYAKHLNDFGTFMKDQGVDLYSISVQNEPDYASEWTYWSTDETTDFLANYGDQITSTRLMSPESFQYAPENASWVPDGGKKFYTKILNNAKAMANCDVFGTHMYGTTRDWMDFPALESSGKEIWMTEVYVPNSEADSANRWPEAVQVSENIHNALVVGNMSAYTWWYIRRSYGLMTEDGKISKRGYCMAQYSKYVRPGDVRIGATESPQKDLYISAFKNDDGQVAIVAVNKSSSEYSQQFSLGSGEKIAEVDRYRTSASENLALTDDMEFDGSSFWSQLPANSVSTYVVTLEGGGSSEPTVDADGYYFHDTFEGDTFTWTGRGAAAVELSGRTNYAGKEALLISGRTSAWHGGTKSISQKVFKPGTAYSFSVDATYLDGDNATDTISFKLQYTGSDGETHYDTIAEAETMKGTWVQLSNKSYTIPEGAKDLMIYVETPETTNDLYIDEAIGAPEGTEIPGAGIPDIIPEITDPPVSVTAGDLNSDKVIDVCDLALVKYGVINGFADAAQERAGDVTKDGKTDLADIVMIQKFLLGQIKAFPQGEAPVMPTDAPDKGDTAGMGLSREAFTSWANGQLAMSEPNEAKTEVPGVQYGTLEQKSYYSAFCGREKKYNVLLPAGYSKDKQYPVLYVMHGYWENQDRMIIEGNGTMYTKQIIGNAIAEGAAEEMIVVFPYIYSSQTQDDCSAMDDANNIAYDNFDTVLTTELMPLIEKEYSVKTGKENTAITGFSMGGRESLNIGMKHPDLFGYVGAICPAPGASGPWKFDTETPWLVYITAGGNDTVVYSTPEGYHNNFNTNNVPHIWHYYEAGYHGDNSIHAHLYNFCRFIFKN